MDLVKARCRVYFPSVHVQSPMRSSQQLRRRAKTAPAAR
ncbi:uncharacterized protein CPUR_08809 [Claviceps purpurea 20.1]|uniref:Uncharacterized protein n=1 Tax=Claviceps purpurea (strain 20.1) TaxID=1111077 RepID=M1WDL1_CLAP2|nr:uncharacterized protein CPUR_08809 [Claviceps purpurea 20.1]